MFVRISKNSMREVALNKDPPNSELLIVRGAIRVMRGAILVMGLMVAILVRSAIRVLVRSTIRILMRGSIAVLVTIVIMRGVAGLVLTVKIGEFLVSISSVN